MAVIKRDGRFFNTLTGTFFEDHDDVMKVLKDLGQVGVPEETPTPAQTRRVTATGAATFGSGAPGELVADELRRLKAALLPRYNEQVRTGRVRAKIVNAAGTITQKAGSRIDTAWLEPEFTDINTLRRAVINNNIVAGRVSPTGETSTDPLVSATSFTGAPRFGGGGGGGNGGGGNGDDDGGGGNGDDDGGNGEKSDIDKLIEQMQAEREERGKIEANRAVLQQAFNDAQVRISGLEAGTRALDVFSSNPSSTYTSMFVDPANAGQLVPVTPSISSLLRQEGLQPTALGARANAPLEGITPEQINPDLFRDLINRMTNRDVSRAGSNPGVMRQIIAMGQLAGINAPAALQARMAQAPTQSRLEGSIFKTGLI